MIRVFALLAILAGVPLAAGSDLSAQLQEHKFVEVDSLSAIPLQILEHLGANEPGLKGVADKNEPFNVTDLIGNSSWPMRRLLAAGFEGETWLVAIERGGRGYSVEVFLFKAHVEVNRWVLLTRPDSLLQVIDDTAKTEVDVAG